MRSWRSRTKPGSAWNSVKEIWNEALRERRESEAHPTAKKEVRTTKTKRKRNRRGH